MSTGSDAETGVAQNPRVVYRDLAGEEGGVLLHLDTGQYHGLNGIGSMIWHLLDGERTPSVIAGEVRVHVEQPAPALEEDVLRFLDDLRQRDLVVG